MFIKSILNRLNRLVKRRSVQIVLGISAGSIAVLTLLYHQIDARAQLDDARRADAIIVLGSAVWPGGRPSPSLYARTQHAIALYQAGYAPLLILCGGLGGNPPTEAEVMRRLAASAGVPASAMILEDQSHSTEESLRNAQMLMAARGLRRAIIVSDPFHLYRAEIIARDVGIEAYGSGARNSPTYTRTLNRIWYTARESLAVVWYYATRALGEPVWLYGILKGKI